MSIEEDIAQGAAELGLALPEGAAARMAAHLALVEKWNRVHNLTAVKEAAQMVRLHVLDSLTLVRHLPAAGGIADIGTGAGFPGLPIAIVRPELAVALLDSSHKKCAFLEQAKSELGLDNVTVACTRVEKWDPGRRFEAVVSRAFADLADFVAQSAHLLAPGGKLLAMKGVHPYEEIARLPASHRVSEVLELKVPALDAKRHLVVVEAA